VQSRKRSYAEDGSSQIAKKRALTGGDGSPMHLPNGALDDQDDQKDEALEVTTLCSAYLPLSLLMGVMMRIGRRSGRKLSIAG
jgi:hypothetical protein